MQVNLLISIDINTLYGKLYMNNLIIIFKALEYSTTIYHNFNKLYIYKKGSLIGQIRFIFPENSTRQAMANEETKLRND